MKPIDRLTDDELGQRLRSAMKALPDAPPALQRAAIDLWRPAQPLDSALKTAVGAVLRRISAVLTFDSWAGPALAHGMRSVRAPTRHLLFSAMGRDIDLRISPALQEFALTGQILGPDESGAIELAPHDAAAGNGAARMAQLDALGEFRIDGVGRGTYVLTLRMTGDEIVLPPIEVGDCLT